MKSVEIIDEGRSYKSMHMCKNSIDILIHVHYIIIKD